MVGVIEEQQGGQGAGAKEAWCRTGELDEVKKAQASI